MNEEDCAREASGFSKRKWCRAKGDYIIRYHRVPEPWQIVAGKPEPDEAYVEWIGRQFTGFEQRAPAAPQAKSLDPELVKRLQNIRAPTFEKTVPDKYEGRVFRGLEETKNKTAAQREAAVNQLLKNLEVSNMGTGEIFANFSQILMNLNDAVQKVAPGVNVVQEIREWLQVLRSFVLPVADALKKNAPLVYMNLLKIIAEAVLLLTPEIVGWINDILIKAGKEAITYSVTSLVASPFIGPILGVIL